MGFKHSSGCRVEGSGLTSGGMGGSKKGAARERGGMKWWDMGSQAGARNSGQLVHAHSTARGPPELSEHGNQIHLRKSRESTNSRRAVGFGVM